MTKTRKLAALIAALLVPLSAQAAPIKITNFSPSIVINAPGSSPATEPGEPFYPVGLLDESAGGIKPMMIDGSRAESRVDVGEIDQDESDGDQDRPGLQTRQFEMQLALTCRISGHDLIIANKGADPITAGTTIKWQVKGSGQKGYLAMQSDVAPGKGFKANGVLEGGVDGERCIARGV
jgi:hypothetical protein